MWPQVLKEQFKMSGVWGRATNGGWAGEGWNGSKPSIITVFAYNTEDSKKNESNFYQIFFPLE